MDKNPHTRGTDILLHWEGIWDIRESLVGNVCLLFLLRPNFLIVHLCSSVKTNKKAHTHTEMYAYVCIYSYIITYINIINNTIPLTPHVSLQVRRYSLRWCHSWKEKQMVLLDEAACLLKCHGYTEIKPKMKGKKNSHLNNELSHVSSEPRSSDNEKKHSQTLCSACTVKLKPHVCHVTSHSG